MKGLTLTIVTPKIQSVNYGETIGNVSTLKKLSTGTDNPKKLITYFSDKAIKYDVKRIGREQYGWHLMDKSVVKIFVKNYSNGIFNHLMFLKEMIINYDEFDLFGGMFADIANLGEEVYQKINSEEEIETIVKTLDNDLSIKFPTEFSFKVKKLKDFFDKKTKKDVTKISQAIRESIGKEISYSKALAIEDTNKLKRSQPVRFSNGYSISEFVYDMNLLNDIDAYNRYIQYIAGEKKQSLVYPEEHFTYYTYTLNIDLDKVGAIEKEEDGTVVFEPVVDPAIRAKRVSDILEIVLLYLNREIKGRKERLTPVFLIGGIYDAKHPFFENAIYFTEVNQKLQFKFSDIQKVFKTYQSIQDISKDTHLYYDESFVNPEGICPSDITRDLSSILDEMKKTIESYYFNSYHEYAERMIDKIRDKKLISAEEINKLNEELEKLEKEQKELEESLEGLQKRRMEFLDKLNNILQKKD